MKKKKAEEPTKIERPLDIAIPRTRLPEQLKDSVSSNLQGNPYELYLLLQSLKAGGINFDQFMAQATAWANRSLASENPTSNRKGYPPT